MDFFWLLLGLENREKIKDAALCESQDADFWNLEVPIDKKTQVSPLQDSP